METGITYRQTLKLIALVLLYYLLFSSVALVFSIVSLFALVLMSILVPLLFLGYRLYVRDSASTAPICSIPVENSDLDAEPPAEESATVGTVGEVASEQRGET